DRLLAPLRIARAQRRREDALEQLRLAVGGAAEDAQIAPPDAVAGQFRDRPYDLPLGLLEVADSAAHLPLDHPEVDQLADQRRVGARVLTDVLERVEGTWIAGRHHRPP